MGLTNAPTKITEAMTRLIECPTVQTILTGVAAGAAQQARFWYPNADPITATMPFFVLSRTRERYMRSTSDGTFGDGQIECVIHLDDSVATGTIESYITIAEELCGLRTDGIYITGAEATLSSEPTSAMQATDDSSQVVTGISYKTFTVLMEWEG